MMGFSKASGKKENNDAVSMDAGSCDITDLRKKMDEQVEEMKELSNATMTIVEKVRKLKTEDLTSHMERIDARLVVLENHMSAVDKKQVEKDDLPKKECVPDKKETMTLPDLPMKKDELPKKESKPAKDKSIALPDLPIKKEESHTDKKIDNVIETTLDAKKSTDCISDTIKHYENEKNTVASPAKSNIFTKFMDKIRIGKTKTVAVQSQKKIEDKPVSVVPKVNTPCAICDSVEKLPSPVEAKKNSDDTNLCVNNACESRVSSEMPNIDLMAVDKDNLKVKMETMIASANQMAFERKYSDATEVYLKLADAYDKNMDNLSVRELGTQINELYDKISSNLLNTLMTSDDGHKMSAFGESKIV